MLASPIASRNETLEGSLSRLDHEVASIRSISTHASPAARTDTACALMRTADGLFATAIELLDRSQIEEASGLSEELLLQLQARRMGSEARMITNAASSLRAMPNLSSTFKQGVVSWGQVRAIVSACRRATSEGRTVVDRLVGQHALTLAEVEPDRLVQLVDEEVARQRADLAVAREDRQIDRGFLAVQDRLDGSGTIYGEGDAQSIATIVEALDAIADAPQNGEAGGMSRAEQRYQAFVAMCEASLNGGTVSTRPRPRLIATIDVSALADGARTDATSLLWPLAGRPARLTSVARDMLLCDATIVPVIFDRGQPVAVGDAAAIISPKVRTALIARDGGCRFPGCSAPASWCDAHHIIPGYGNQANDLVLLCRRCHRRLHRHHWRIRLQTDGAITFSRRGCSHTSLPRHRAPPSPLE
jgi:uncharacterized protein DUF222